MLSADPGTCLVVKGNRLSPIGERCDDSRNATATVEWFPRVVSWYGLSENDTHWSRRLDIDVEFKQRRPSLPSVKLAAQPVDFYGREDADLAFLSRKPVCFAVFAKPGLLDDVLAAELSAYWGCVHVSAANALATGLPDSRTESDLRSGKAVNARDSMAALLAALDSDQVREHGYVLTGLPRHMEELSVSAQIDKVFAVNPPEVLICMSCPTRDLAKYCDGLILESTQHERLTQSLNSYLNELDSSGHIRWYESLRNRNWAELDLMYYEKYSSVIVDEVVKRFNAEFVITIDGRRPVSELLKTIKSKLMTMPLQRTILPEVIVWPEKLNANAEEFETDWYEMMETKSVAEQQRSENDGYKVNVEDEECEINVEDEGERIRLMSEYGRLCPVNFSRGSYKLGSDQYCMKFMGRHYYFAGFEEMRLFGECPRQFLEIPRPGLPIRSIFYGPETLTNPTAKAVCKFFGCDLIDVERIRQIREQNDKMSLVSGIVKAVLKIARNSKMSGLNEIEPDEFIIVRNAIGDWIRLHFGVECDEYEGVDYEGSERETTENYSNPETLVNGLVEEQQLTQLKNIFESYEIDFVNDLAACIHAYKEPNVLKNHFQVMMQKRRSFGLNFPNKDESSQLKFTDFIVHTIQIRNNNWVIVNAPMDWQLINKLIEVALNPIQVVFIHDTDPLHKILLSDEEMSSRNQNEIFEEIFKNMKNGTSNKTKIERIDFPKFIEKEERMLNYYENGYENELDIENDKSECNLSHDYLLEIIMPEITERLHQYTESLFKKWQVFKNCIPNKMNQYMDFSVIECQSVGSTTVKLKNLVQDCLYHIKKFLSANVYDVSKTVCVDNEIPTLGRYDGDTSIYCPVKFANGKLVIGSNKYKAVYKNRYYYMSSFDNLKLFMLNPYKYTSFVSPSKMYPKPKVSLITSFGLKAENLIDNLLDTFDLTLVDSCDIIKNKLLPDNMPMLGKMYEQPTFKKILDEYFIFENQKKRIDRLRQYIDMESALINDKEWIKMNTIFFQTNDGICYKNYPRNLIELKYLVENELSPDLIIEVVADQHEEHEQAIITVTKNWLTYQLELINKVIAQDEITRRNTIISRLMLFKNELQKLKQQKKISLIKKRLEHILNLIVDEIINEPTVYNTCDTALNNNNVSSNLSLEYSELTLKQKKIILYYGLNVNDFSDLDDFTILEQIDQRVINEIPEKEFLISKCFNNNLEFPTNGVVEEHLITEKNTIANMRTFSESSNIPWITVSTHDSQSNIFNEVAQVLMNNTDIFETTLSVNIETSENMLCSGEVYLSKFSQWCPVRVYEEPISVQQFYIDYENHQIFPVIHRNYVYFISGSVNRDKFTNQPLKYISQPFSRPPNFPLKIAVIGAPKSGKSDLTKNLCARFGLQSIKIEEFVEPYFKMYGWTDHSKSALQKFRQNGMLSDNILMEIAKSAMQTTRAIVQGFVLDGFPMTEKQFELLDSSGIILHKVFFMQSSNEHSNDITKPDVLSQQETRTTTDSLVSEKWILENYGNIVSKAEDVETSILTCVKSWYEYFTSMYENKPCRLVNIPVTKRESTEKLSMYLDLCPVCKTDYNCLTRPENLEALRRHLVQYLSCFYWVCSRHWDRFISDTKKYVNSTPRDPELLPEIIADEELLCNRVLCEYSEFCVVCVLARLWNPIYRPGLRSFAVVYSKRLYVFCSANCQREFVQKPFLYSQYIMHVNGPEYPFKSISEKLVVDNLPLMGYLEQTVAIPVSAALVELSAMKPIYPGLSPEITAMVFFALHIGMNGSDDDVNDYYRNAFKQFVDTCHHFKRQVFQLKSII